MKRWLIIGAVVVVGVLGLVAWLKRPSGNGEFYRTATVKQGELVQTVKATGTVQPIHIVQVGSQVTGIVKKLFVDYNSPVTEGQVIAQIDDTTFRARVAQDEANLKKALADVEQGRAKLNLARKEAQRDRELASREVISKSALDTSVTNSLALNAQLKTLEAVVEQARATLEIDKTNLGYTTIRSPVSGVVIARNVDEGQTVIAAMAVQTIYTLATDLRQIQVQGSIPEADIGRIKVGQPVRFTVDAYPDENFYGQVQEVRIAATTVQNVITYPIIISAENAEQKLFPSMTANIYVEIARRDQALMVPNASLRFKPTAAALGAEAKTDKDGAEADQASRELWVSNALGIAPVKVTVGINDGTNTEIVSGDLKAGDEVVIGVEEKKAGEAKSNPFMPKMNRNQRKVTRVR
jgi:HlyD family secretion protein